MALDKYILGIAILAGVVFGGNSAPSFYLDGVLQVIIILSSSYVIWRNIGEKVDWRASAFIFMLLAVVSLQLLPLPPLWLDSLQGITSSLDAQSVQSRTISLNIGRTIEMLSWVAAMAFLFHALSKLRFTHAYDLIPIFLLAVACHLVAGLIQYSASSPQGVSEQIAGFQMRAAMFANENHFSALCFVSIPVAFSYFYDRRRLGLFLIYLSFVLLVLLAVGSRAGVVIGFSITVLSALIIFQRRSMSMFFGLLGSGLIGLYVVGLWARIAQEGLQQGAREIFARTTLEGIWDNLTVGVGYGNFVDAYRHYENAEDIVRYYINHAHNDFLELAFEGGIPAIVMIAAFLALFLKRVAETYRQPLRYACALSILFLMVHSAVDYPLRTMALSIAFTMLTALLFHRGMSPGESSGQALAPGGEEIASIHPPAEPVRQVRFEGQ